MLCGVVLDVGLVLVVFCWLEEEGGLVRSLIESDLPFHEKCMKVQLGGKK